MLPDASAGRLAGGLAVGALQNHPLLLLHLLHGARCACYARCSCCCRRRCLLRCLSRRWCTARCRHMHVQRARRGLVPCAVNVVFPAHVFGASKTAERFAACARKELLTLLLGCLVVVGHGDAGAHCLHPRAHARPGQVPHSSAGGLPVHMGAGVVACTWGW